MSDKKIIFTFIILLSVFFTSSGLLTFLGKINTYAILMLTFFIIGLNIVSRHREYLKTKYIPLLIAYIVPIIISYLYGSTAIFNRHIAYATLFLCTPVYIIIKKNYNQKEQFLFYSFCVCLSVLNAIISYIHLENNPYACRQAHVVQASGESVGGYITKSV